MRTFTAPRVRVAVSDDARDKDKLYLRRSRLVETPRGMLTIDFFYTEWPKATGVEAELNLYGTDGWNSERRKWKELSKGESLPELIAEWTGLPADGAEALVAEMLEQWQVSPAYTWNRRTSRWSFWLFLGVAAFFLAFLGL